MRIPPSQRPALRIPDRHAAARLAGLAALCLASAAVAQEELRALWVDAFHNGYRTPAQTSQLVDDARAGNFNTLIVQVRKRGDAYYDSLFEPRALGLTPADYDPLADLIAKAHAGPEPLEVHAWIVAYNIWNSQSSAPAQPDHPYNRHPEWLTFNESGAQWDGANYQFDPALPAVQRHTFDVIMDLVTRYDIDGLHFDYIRYSESGSPGTHNVWGYHSGAVARFNTLYGRSGTPAASDPAWLEFRRAQVTALVRKTWLSVRAVRPEVCVSAACITWGNAPTSSTKAAFETTEAYRRVLQDWRGWLEEGILDLAIPMVYRRYDTAAGAQQFADWSRRAKEFQYGRATAVGIGNYLNTIPENLAQIKVAREAAPGSGLTTAGLAGYSYAVTNDAGDSRQEFFEALTDPAAAALHTPGEPPLFPQPVAVPPQPWKTDSAVGHLAGTAADGRDGTALDGAVVTLEGPEARTLTTDATGFFGAVGLLPGAYEITISFPGLPDRVEPVTVAGGSVADVDLSLDPEPFEFRLEELALLEDPLRVILAWRTRSGHSYAVQMSADLQSWTTLASGIPPDGDFMNSFQDTPPASAKRRFYRVVETGP